MVTARKELPPTHVFILIHFFFQIQVEVTEKVTISGATQETVAVTIIRKVEKIQR
jgi:hypothetical protein